VNKIKNVQFKAKKSAGKIETRIEVLNDTSALVDEKPPDEVYQNMNIWVGKAGFDKNIEDAKVNFTVERSWIENNNIDKSTIKLCRHHDDNWNKLPTKKLSANESVIKLQAETPGFSPFAITGETIKSEQSAELNSKNKEQQSDEKANSENENVDEQQDVTEQSQVTKTEKNEAIGVGAWSIEWFIAAIATMILAVALYIKKRGQ
jgi:PGF-pre-PGF domain-containing protein